MNNRRIIPQLSIALFLMNVAGVNAFVSPQTRKSIIRKTTPPNIKNEIVVKKNEMNFKTELRMYNLPPPNDNNNNKISEIISSLAPIFIITAIFVSPLGSIIFAIFNSFLLFSILTPFLLIGGFQLWQYFNTISGACPNCSSPVTTLKNGEPTLCINCGAVIRSNSSNDGVELCNAPPTDDFFDSGSGGFFDSFFGGGPKSANVDIDVTPSSPFGGERRPESSLSKRKKIVERTIIDVEVEEE